VHEIEPQLRRLLERRARLHPYYIDHAITLVKQRSRQLDARSDVYALGVLLFRAVAGRPPFVGPNPISVASAHVAQALPSLRSVNPGVRVSPELEKIILRCLAKAPADRFPSARALREALEALLGPERQARLQTPVYAPIGTPPPRRDPPTAAAPPQGAKARAAAETVSAPVHPALLRSASPAPSPPPADADQQRAQRSHAQTRPELSAQAEPPLDLEGATLPSTAVAPSLAREPDRTDTLPPAAAGQETFGVAFWAALAVVLAILGLLAALLWPST